MTPPKSQLVFQLKTLLNAALGGVLISLGKPAASCGNVTAFMGSDGTVPESKQ